MSYVHTTVTINKELVEEAKRLGLNMSETLRNALKDNIEFTNLSQWDKFVDKQEAELERFKTLLDNIKGQIAQLKMERQEHNKRVEQMYNVVEINELTSMQINDMKFLTNLVDVLRVKYNDQNFSISGVREYWKLKGVKK